jgi:hypothetical protein
MAAFPTTLPLAPGVIAHRDLARLAVWLVTAAKAGKPVLTDAARRRLAALALVVDGDDEQDPRASGGGRRS